MSFFGNGPLSPVANQTVKRLLKHIKRQPGDENGVNKKEEKLEEKAVKSLAKKLKASQLDDLEYALTSQDPQSKCVLINRSMDGRLQVSTRKGLPHVIYCKMFRWPDIQTQHELRSISACSSPFAKKMENVCINPYHFELTASHGIPPILVPINKGRENSSSTNGASYPINVDPATHALQSVSIDRDEPGPSLNQTITREHLENLEINKISQELHNDAEMLDNQALNSPTDSLSSPYSQILSPTEYVPVGYQEQKHWCSIAYYELNQRVGESFSAGQPSVIVDGYCAPSDADRFCLGQLTNVTRQPIVQEARKHIGRGVRFYMDNQKVFAENLSDRPIFIQSPLANHMHQWHPGTVAKIPPDTYWMIFDCQEFAKLLGAAVRQFEPVYSLTRMCTIRVSLVKGWGEEYRRQTITSTPCWIEVHMNGPLQWLDRVLQEMGGPAYSCPSYT